MNSTATIDDVNAALRQTKDIFERSPTVPANLDARMNAADQTDFLELHQAGFAAIMPQVATKYQYVINCADDIFDSIWHRWPQQAYASLNTRSFELLNRRLQILINFGVKDHQRRPHLHQSIDIQTRPRYHGMNINLPILRPPHLAQLDSFGWRELAVSEI